MPDLCTLHPLLGPSEMTHWTWAPDLDNCYMLKVWSVEYSLQPQCNKSLAPKQEKSLWKVSTLWFHSTSETCFSGCKQIYLWKKRKIFFKLLHSDFSDRWLRGCPEDEKTAHFYISCLTWKLKGNWYWRSSTDKCCSSCFLWFFFLLTRNF